MSDTPRTDDVHKKYRTDVDPLDKIDALDSLAMALERELAAKDAQLTSCYDRMCKAEVRLHAALLLLRRYLKETPLGHQPHMIAHEVEALLTLLPKEEA